MDETDVCPACGTPYDKWTMEIIDGVETWECGRCGYTYTLEELDALIDAMEV